MADYVQKRVQYIERVGTQTDGDKTYRIFPWQYVALGNRRFLEPVDYVGGKTRSTEKEITSIEFIDGGSTFVSGGQYGTGGNVGLLRG